jgi:hypothetical protein
MTLLDFPPLFSSRIHQGLFFSGLAIVAISMPNSLWMMSFGQFVMAGNWLIEGRYKEKVLRFWKNKAAVAFTLIYLIHFLALVLSEDPSTELRNIKIKLPILTLTFLIASSESGFNALKSKAILLLFSSSVMVTTFIGFANYLGGEVSEFRQLSPFISHIRFGLMIAFSMFLIPWVFYAFFIADPENVGKIKRKRVLLGLLSVFAIVWLGYFLTIMQSLSAFVALIPVVVFLAFYFLYKLKDKMPAILMGVFTLVIVTSIIIILVRTYRMVTYEIPLNISELPTHTPYGNPYNHYPEILERENGHLVYILISDAELREEWNNMSNLDYDGSDFKDQWLRFTLYRYMASKGLPRDKTGFDELTDADIRAVEEGIGNYLYTKWPGIKVRIHQTFWEVDRLRKGASPEGHSLGQRIEYWEAAWLAFLKRPFLGWGVAGIHKAMDYGFTQSSTGLAESFRHRPHNQYLTFLLYFGIFGSLIVYSSLIFTIRRSGSIYYLPNIIFLIILAVSMINEDTLETQAGLTFFVFFFCFFNFLYREAEK